MRSSADFASGKTQVSANRPRPRGRVLEPRKRKDTGRDDADPAPHRVSGLEGPTSSPFEGPGPRANARSERRCLSITLRLQSMLPMKIATQVVAEAGIAQNNDVIQAPL